MQYGNYALDFQGVDPYNPLNLPPFTIRVKFDNDFTPTQGTVVLVDPDQHIWDITYEPIDGQLIIEYTVHMNMTELLGANTSGITNMDTMFQYCRSLTSVSLFDTSSVTSMENMFEGCTSLTSVPLFNTSSCTDMYRMFGDCTSLTLVPLFDTSSCNFMSFMFYKCTNVQSGALALYQQASTQANPPGNHHRCFYNCGVYTVTGAAELAQIPDDWK